jgi:NADPH-dependent glutamate synthase beta subunit-like oxidoreductase
VHTDAGGYVTAIAEGDLRGAYLLARAHNPFASICGRVCAAPCETACRRGVVDAPIAIRALKRFVTERYGVESFEVSEAWHEAHGPVPAATHGSVGVVGGGPAGLAAAHDLRLAGHPVTVYESAAVLGGQMVLGIPEYRLSRELIRRETGAVLELGIEVELSFRVGVDATFAELLERHEALFVAVGTMRGRSLDLPGSELDGVFRAVEYLLNVNQGFKVDLGERVVVVGGGNVAFDAARTALRAAAGGAASEEAEAGGATGGPSDQSARVAMATTLDVARAVRRAGVRDVTVVALESPEEIPADPEEIAEAEGEGITILYRRGPHRFVGEDVVQGLETIEVASVFDEAGRFAPTFIDHTEAVLPADSVILAVGQAADLDFLGDVAIERSRPGGLQVDPATLRTSHPKVWAGGDVARGPRNLIDAIADGKAAAASIHAVLGGSVPQATSVRVELRTREGYRRLSTGYDSIERVEIPAVAHERRIGFSEVEVGYSEDEALRESLRCLRCFDNIMLDPDLCILCGLCVDVCPTNCITIVRADLIGAGVESQSVLLLDEDQCIRCGLCINRCPPAALTMVHAKEVAG